MKIRRLLFSLILVLLLTGCKTTFYKPGASDADFQRDLMLAEGYATSKIQNATVMPTQSGLEAMMRGIAVPATKRRLINDYMKELGWTKQKTHETQKSTETRDTSVEGVKRQMDEDMKRLFPNSK